MVNKCRLALKKSGLINLTGPWGDHTWMILYLKLALVLVVCNCRNLPCNSLGMGPWWERPCFLNVFHMWPIPTSTLVNFCFEMSDICFERFAMTSCSWTMQSASIFSALKISHLALARSLMRFASRLLISSIVCKNVNKNCLAHNEVWVTYHWPANSIDYFVQVRKSTTRVMQSIKACMPVDRVMWRWWHITDIKMDWCVGWHGI